MANLIARVKTRLIERFELDVDGARAFRAAVAFGLPLTVCHWMNRPAEALFISMAALNLSLPDLRGAYRFRTRILAAITLVAAGSAFLGVLSAGSTVGAVAAMALIALLGGVWRQVSADYGPSTAISSALLFLLGLSQPGGWRAGLHLAELTGLGGAVAMFFHACYWLVRPQHALRYAVAETWVAASDLVCAMRLESGVEHHARSESVANRERELRAALDRTFSVLGAAENRGQAALLKHLEEMRREVVHFTMRAVAFNTSLESLMEEPTFSRHLPVVDSVLKALSDASRSVAITLIIHRQENFAASNVRLRRCQHLIKALDEQIAAFPAGCAAAAQARATLEQIARVLPGIHDALAKTADHTAARPGFSASLPDISTRSLLSLGAWMGPASRPDPVLIRYSARMAMFTMFAVALYKGLAIPRGYWIAFTIVVVLQPDYGSTRQRAAARLGGTLAGTILAAALLWISLPLSLLDGLAVLTAFAFAYFLKRHYGWAIFFVTVNIVLVTETMAVVHRDFIEARVLSTLLGGGLALAAARIFWPVWEGEKFPALLAAAIRANVGFLQAMSPWLGLPVSNPGNLLMAKRRAENANRHVAASVERLQGEPVGRRENPERAAALATYNQRVTRALTVLAVQLPDAGKLEAPPLSAVAEMIESVLEGVARTIENGCEPSAVLELEVKLGSLEKEHARAANLPVNPSGGTASTPALTWIQLSKAVAEIRAMTLALNMTASAK